MTSSYGWIIDKDHLVDGEYITTDEAGTVGPHDIPAAIEATLRFSSGGDRFQILDDDGILYYEGRYTGSYDDTMFAPLEDFGTPNAGATEIRYQNKDGIWETP